MQSPRVSSASIAQGPLGSVVSLFEGATSPRAAGGGATSPRRTAAGPPSSLRKALATRGGVAREKDGFEVFYGVESKEHRRRRSPNQDHRDGFDKFFGKKSRDRVAPVTVAAAATLASADGPEERKAREQAETDQTRQQETQLGHVLSGGAPGGTPVAAPIDSEDCPTRIRRLSNQGTDLLLKTYPSASPRQAALAEAEVAATTRTDGAEGGAPAGGARRLSRAFIVDGFVPEGVPTYSLSAAAVLPRTVQMYSLCAPKLPQGPAGPADEYSLATPRAVCAVAPRLYVPVPRAGA